MVKGLASFDSATAMAVATARILRGEDFPALGQPKYLQHIVRYSELIPTRLALAIYGATTGFEGISHRAAGSVRAGEIAEWVADLYPMRPYPAAIVGSSNGALCHLAAALDAPWLPQTFLVPLRRDGGGVDDPRGDLDGAREAGLRLLAANPEFQLHQMHDPNQDRLSLQYLTYFRVKYRTLPEAYRRFLLERVEPGGVLIVADCGKTWPTTRVGDRYVFQFGAVGGMEAEEYRSDGPRVADLLARSGVPMRRWDPPAPDRESPEAEWGYESALDADIEAAARARGLRVVRLSFHEPEDLSPLVADFHRASYRRRGLPADRLLAESFILLEPYWALRAGLVPFWMTFNTRQSYERLWRYLGQSDRYDEVYAMLFAHGARSVGLPTIEEWRSVFRCARKGGAFVGVNEKAYPAHFSALARYHLEMKRMPQRYPLPKPVAFDVFRAFYEANRDRYAVRLTL